MFVPGWAKVGHASGHKAFILTFPFRLELAGVQISCLSPHRKKAEEGVWEGGAPLFLGQPALLRRNFTSNLWASVCLLDPVSEGKQLLSCQGSL